jgi:hypothetical protein
MKVYIVAYSYDWNEGNRLFRTIEELETWFRDEFEIGDAPAWSEAFNKAIENEIDGHWKSLQVLTLDTETLEMTDKLPTL